MYGVAYTQLRLPRNRPSQPGMGVSRGAPLEPHCGQTYQSPRNYPSGHGMYRGALEITHRVITGTSCLCHCDAYITGLDIKHLAYMPIGHVVLKIYAPWKNFHMTSQYLCKPVKVIYTAGKINKYMPRLENHLLSRARNHKSLCALGQDLHALDMQTCLNVEPCIMMPLIPCHIRSLLSILYQLPTCVISYHHIIYINIKSGWLPNLIWPCLIICPRTTDTWTTDRSCHQTSIWPSFITFICDSSHMTLLGATLQSFIESQLQD